jgi:hypothetical protein
MGKDEEDPEGKKQAEEGDEAGEPWNETPDEADPAMLVTEARLNENEDEAEGEEIEREKEDKEKRGDMEKPKDKGMDSMKAILSQISRRDSLAQRLSKHIGVFDHKEKTLSEVAKYGVTKLKLSCKPGHEESVLDGYLKGARLSTPAMSQDSAPVMSDCVDAYLAGGK